MTSSQPLPPRADWYDPKGWGDEPRAEASPRPHTVLAGCILAWVGAAFGMAIAVAYVTATPRSPLVSGLPLDQRESATTSLHLVGILNMTWCPLVMMVAYFAFRRAAWAAATLAVMGGVWVVLNLVNAMAGGGRSVLLGILWTAASVTLVYFARSSKEWYRTAVRRRANA